MFSYLDEPQSASDKEILNLTPNETVKLRDALNEWIDTQGSEDMADFNSYVQPGGEAVDVSGMGALVTDAEVIRLVTENNDSNCARAILDAVHEVVAKVLAKMIATGETAIPSTISGDVQAHIRADHRVCKGHQSEAQRIAQDWVDDLTSKVGHYVKR